jgi:hypothetical protein
VAQFKVSIRIALHATTQWRLIIATFANSLIIHQMPQFIIVISAVCAEEEKDWELIFSIAITAMHV